MEKHPKRLFPFKERNIRIFAGINLRHGRRFKNGPNSCFYSSFIIKFFHIV
ncbi:unnamed protein product, partial [Larinioides sclopetarius]